MLVTSIFVIVSFLDLISVGVLRPFPSYVHPRSGAICHQGEHVRLIFVTDLPVFNLDLRYQISASGSENQLHSETKPSFQLRFQSQDLFSCICVSVQKGFSEISGPRDWSALACLQPTLSLSSPACLLSELPFWQQKNIISTCRNRWC